MMPWHLKINKWCDCKYPITWVAENCRACFIDRSYVDRIEPTLNGVSISVKLPDSDSDLYAEFAANDDGWMYVSDRNVDGLKEVEISIGIREVEKNVEQYLKDIGEI